MAAHKTRSYIYLTVASLIWGIASVVIKLTLPAFQPLFFLEYRFFLSFLFALPFLLMRPRLHIKTFWDSAVQRGLTLLVSFDATGVVNIAEMPVFLQRDRQTCPRTNQNFAR
jgi:drug/metabolite transporter (DMT)-like permease